MKKGEFIYTSKRMVREYFNRYVNKTDKPKITLNDIRVVDFRNKQDNYKVLLTTLHQDNLYYGVTYYKDTNKMRSYIYKKLKRGFRGKTKLMEGENNEY